MWAHMNATYPAMENCVNQLWVEERRRDYFQNHNAYTTYVQTTECTNWIQYELFMRDSFHFVSLYKLLFELAVE